MAGNLHLSANKPFFQLLALSKPIERHRKLISGKQENGTGSVGGRKKQRKASQSPFKSFSKSC